MYKLFRFWRPNRLVDRPTYTNDMVMKPDGLSNHDGWKLPCSCFFTPNECWGNRKFLGWFWNRRHIWIHNGKLTWYASRLGTHAPMGDFKNIASISLINVYKLSKADLFFKNNFKICNKCFSCIMPSFAALECSAPKLHGKKVVKIVTRVTLLCNIFSNTFDSTVNCIKHYSCIVKW